MSKRSSGSAYAVKLWFDWQEYEQYRSLSEELLGIPVEQLFHSIIRQGIAQVVTQLSEEMEVLDEQTNNNN